MIIDGHAHACGKFLTSQGIVKELEANDVDKVVLVPGELNSKSEYSLPNIASIFSQKNVVKITNSITKFVMKLTGKVKDIPKGNEYVFELKSKATDRIIQFVWVTTGIENIKEYLNTKFKEWAFHGVKLHQCWETFSIDSGFFRQVASWAEEHDLPLFIHLQKDRDVFQLIEYKREHPNLKLIVAHLFGLELFIQKNLIDENLYFDISPLQLISNNRLLKAIDYVGAKRVLFGTDTPYGDRNNLHKSIKRIKALDLSEEEKDMILGLNMKSLLKL